VGAGSQLLRDRAERGRRRGGGAAVAGAAAAVDAPSVPGREKVFVDYSGKLPYVWDERTGEKIPVEHFVAVLGASNFTHAEATRTQRSATGSRATCGRWSISAGPRGYSSPTSWAAV